MWYNRTACDYGTAYAGETGRDLKPRINEHTRMTWLGNASQSAIAHHCIHSGHSYDGGNKQIVDVTPNTADSFWNLGILKHKITD